MKYQPPTEPVDIRVWQGDEGNPFYPEGQREKLLLISPVKGCPDFCLPQHRYLFKETFHRYKDQYWAEVLAYKIGCLMNISVPPAFVAFNSETEVCGALIEWFYTSKSKYFSGGEVMTRMIPGFDREKGRQHNFETVEVYSSALNKKGIIQSDWLQYWAKTFVFDALIGNTDRHQDNWGWLARTGKESVSLSLAPNFDNGTSLGHEIFPRNFWKYRRESKIAKYVNDGTHHMKWRRGDANRLNHGEFLITFCNKYPFLRSIMRDSLNIDADELWRHMEELTKFTVPVPFSKERLDFTFYLLEYRRKILLELLERNNETDT